MLDVYWFNLPKTGQNLETIVIFRGIVAAGTTSIEETIAFRQMKQKASESYRWLHCGDLAAKGSKQTFAAVATKVCYADKTTRRRNRPNDCFRSLGHLSRLTPKEPTSSL